MNKLQDLIDLNDKAQRVAARQERERINTILDRGIEGAKQAQDGLIQGVLTSIKNQVNEGKE